MYEPSPFRTELLAIDKAHAQLMKMLHERCPVGTEIRFVCRNRIYHGTVKDITFNGELMVINNNTGRRRRVRPSNVHEIL